MVQEVGSGERMVVGDRWVKKRRGSVVMGQGKVIIVKIDNLVEVLGMLEERGLWIGSVGEARKGKGSGTGGSGGGRRGKYSFMALFEGMIKPYFTHLGLYLLLAQV